MLAWCPSRSYWSGWHSHPCPARRRRLYYADTADGTTIDATLVREGLARAVRIHGRYGAYLAALQAEAAAAGRGCLWTRARAP